MSGWLELLVRFRRSLILLTHLGVFAVTPMMALAVRYDGDIPTSYLELAGWILLFFASTKLVVFWLFRQFSGWWRFVTLDDLLSMGAATATAALAVGGVFLLVGPSKFPRSIFLLDALFTAVLLGGLRVSLRLFRERMGSRVGAVLASRPVLVVGTGAPAEGFVREVGRSPGLGLRVMGLVTTDANLVGSRIGSVPIRGTVEDLPRLISRLQVQQVILALDPGHGDITRRVMSLCTSADVSCRTLPPTEDIVQGRVSVGRLREVDLTDLLGRPPVRLQTGPIVKMASGETVLVTGAGGSIGSELCRQVARFGAGRLVLVEQAENPLFHLERELRTDHPQLLLECVVAHVCDAGRMRAVMEKTRPSLVLHAAAHKHVPLMEANPSEAIRNNILGTRTVMEAARAAGVPTAILISTDKAVHPTSVMGASKRMAELVVQALQQESQDSVLAAVRFGNVLGSNGSVIPIFLDQIARGGPVTVTHPDMRRYFMTIPEATQLVLQAGAQARGGEIFVLDMGDPVLIVDVARDLIRLSGLEPDVDIPIHFTGIRPGEKLFEELATDAEETQPTAHPRVFRCTAPPPTAHTVLEAVDRLVGRAAAQQDSSEALRRALFATLQTLDTGNQPPYAEPDNVVHLPSQASHSLPGTHASPASAFPALPAPRSPDDDRRLRGG
jgi:FlaA1/EpsC-like NDP-sugar epimerase